MSHTVVKKTVQQLTSFIVCLFMNVSVRGYQTMHDQHIKLSGVASDKRSSTIASFVAYWLLWFE